MTTRCTLPVRLDNEWNRLRCRPALLRRAAGWQLHLSPRSLESLDDLLRAAGASLGATPGAAETEPGGAADRLLGALVQVAHADDVAARVVLQRMLPGLCNRARRWAGSCGGDWQAAFEELVASAWMVIRTYPVERRPIYVVAGLLRATEHQAFVKAGRRQWRAEVVEPHHFDVPVEPEDEPTEPAAELEEVLEVADTALSDRDRAVLRRLMKGGTAAEAAAALEVSVRTLTNYRDAAIHRVRAAVAAAA